MSSTEMIKYFDINLQTELIVDASPFGLGAILTQVGKSSEINIVAYASRSLTDTEKSYSQIEREALAIIWACEHFQLYLIGSDFRVITDHKPLVNIMSGDKLQRDTLNARLTCLCFLPFNAEVIYRPRKTNPADYQSRHPLPESRTTSTSWLDQQT